MTDWAGLATGFGSTSISCKVGGTFQLGGTSLRHRILSHWCMSFTAEKRSRPCCYKCYISQILGQLKKEAMEKIVKETLLHWYGSAICQINWHRFDLFWLCMIWDELLCACTSVPKTFMSFLHKHHSLLFARQLFSRVCDSVPITLMSSLQCKLHWTPRPREMGVPIGRPLPVCAPRDPPNTYLPRDPPSMYLVCT